MRKALVETTLIHEPRRAGTDGCIRRKRRHLGPQLEPFLEPGREGRRVERFLAAQAHFDDVLAIRIAHHDLPVDDGREGRDHCGGLGRIDELALDLGRIVDPAKDAGQTGRRPAAGAGRVVKL